jgi:hypothetical protein
MVYPCIVAVNPGRKRPETSVMVPWMEGEAHQKRNTSMINTIRIALDATNIT